MTVDNTIKMQEQLQAPRRPRTCLAWYPTNCRCQVKSTKTAQAQIHASLGVLPVAHVLWLSPTGDGILVLSTECAGDGQSLPMGIAGKLQLLHIFFPPPNSLPTYQQLSSQGTSSTHCSELILACTAGHRAVASHQQRVMREGLPYFFPPYTISKLLR